MKYWNSFPVGCFTLSVILRGRTPRLFEIVSILGYQLRANDSVLVYSVSGKKREAIRKRPVSASHSIDLIVFPDAKILCDTGTPSWQ